MQEEGAPVYEADFKEVKYATSKYVQWWIDKAIGMGATIEQAQERAAKDYGISVEELIRRYPEASKGTPGHKEALSAPQPLLTTDYIIDVIRGQLDEIVATRFTGWLGIRFEEGVIREVGKQSQSSGEETTQNE